MAAIKGVLNAEMANLLREHSICEDFRNFLCKFNICTYEAFVWGARNKSEHVDSDLIDAAGIKDITITDRISIRLAWWTAHTEVEKRTAAKKAPPVVESNQPINRDDAKTLHDLFMNRHGFRLGSVRLLSDQLQGRLLREYGANPRGFQAILPDKLIFRDSIVTPIGTNLQFFNGEMPSRSDIFEDNVQDMVDLWTRIRALCNTFSFISIQRPEWFPFVEAEAFSDKLLVWMNQKYDGKRASLAYLVQAYVSTFSYFCNEMRDHDLTLSSLVKNEAHYRSFWTNPYGTPASSSTPPIFQQPTGPRSGNSGQPDNPVGMSSELNRMRSMTDKLSAKFDRFVSDNRGGGGQGAKGGNNRGDRSKASLHSRGDVKGNVKDNDRGSKRKVDHRGGGDNRGGNGDRSKNRGGR
jgi:hypothetical protein